MLSRLPAILLLATLLASGCLHITHSKVERRVIVLPAADPGATLAAAQKICEDVSGGLDAELHQHFPKVTRQQMQGLFLNASEGASSKGGNQVAITVGINYREPLPDAKAIADVCESVVRDAVGARFPAAETAHPNVP